MENSSNSLDIDLPFDVVVSEELDLHTAASLGAADSIHKFLTKYPGEVDILNGGGWTALMYASHYGHCDAMELLLLHGADVNRRTFHGKTPLIFATANGKIDAMQLLLKRDVDLESRTSTDWTALFFAVSLNYPSCVKLLLEHGANPNHSERRFGCTALMIACDKAVEELVELLLMFGADVLARDNLGMTARDMATRKGCIKLQQILQACENKALRKLSKASLHGSTIRTPSPSYRRQSSLVHSNRSSRVSLSPHTGRAPLYISCSDEPPSSVTHLNVPQIVNTPTNRTARSRSLNNQPSNPTTPRPRSRSCAGFRSESCIDEEEILLQDIASSPFTDDAISRVLASYSSQNNVQRLYDEVMEKTDDLHSSYVQAEIDMDRFLVKLGLGEYTGLFRREEIDFSVFLTLNDEDIIDLGITLLGPRRKLTTAIKSLNDRISECDKHAHCQHQEQQVQELRSALIYCHNQTEECESRHKQEIQEIHDDLQELKDIIAEEKYNNSSTWSALKKMKWGKRAAAVEGGKAEERLQQIILNIRKKCIDGM